METSFDVVVVGAGLAGLAAGATAARAGRRVLIVDGHSAGGRARTDERNGFRFNQGAHALYLGGHAARVLGDLGVGVPPGASPSTDQWGVAGSKVLPFSAGKALRSTLLDTVGKAQLARFVRTLRSLESSTLADRSAEAWLTGLDLRPGATAILRTLAHVASYADDLTAISADAVAAQIQLAISDGVRYLDGWQVLVGSRRVERPCCSSPRETSARRARRRHDDQRRRQRAGARSGCCRVRVARTAGLGSSRPTDDGGLPRPRPAPAAAQEGRVRRGRAALPLDARTGR